MTMNIRKYIGLTLALICVSMYSCMSPSGIEVGAPTPEITSVLSDGSEFKLSQLQGNYVLLDFWGSWCPPCIRESPQVVAMYDRYKDADLGDGAGFEMVSVALERTDDGWQKAAKRLRMTWPYQLADVSRFVVTSDIAGDYGVIEVPAKFLIAPDGTLLSVKGSFQEIRKILDSKQK